MTYLFDTRPERPGYRLQRLELLNWGTFDSSTGQVYRFEPEGRTSLLVGHNGSGKSTLVDAILTLLVEPRTRNYNVAAGARKRERTEKSYIRGAYARTSDDANAAVVKYLRPHGANLTAICAVFADEQLGQSFTLCQVLHLTSDGTTDKLLAIADESRELQHDLAGVRQSDELAAHLQRLGYQTTKKFVQYRSWLVRRTGMLPKAMDMFNQTVAVKDIQSLNDFIRQHMLERHNWQENVSKLLTHFQDLSIAHQELVSARRAAELLEPVEKQGLKFRRQAAELTASEQQLAAADTFFRQRTIDLFQPALAQRRTQRTTLQQAIERVKGEQRELAQTQRQLQNEIDLAGGDRLRAIPSLIAIEQGKLDGKRGAFERYHAQLNQAGLAQVVTDSAALELVRSELNALIESTAATLARAQAAYDQAVVERGQRRHLLRDDQQELDALGTRKNNLPASLVAMREQLCADLQLRARDLPFAAELMSVDPDERRWEASVELVLRPLALSLLVPEQYYGRVRGYIDRTKLVDARGAGQRLDYLLVGRGAEESGDRRHRQSLVRKLRFREGHPLAPWVRGEVARRFDYQCCESVDEFAAATRKAMTENRHVKYAGDRHTKDDRPRASERRHFVLGWDNREKRRLIADRLESLTAEIAHLDKTIAAHQAERERLEQVRHAASQALALGDFDAIDVRRHQEAIETLEAERRQLESANTAVQALKARLAETDEACQRLDQQRDELVGELRDASRDIADGERLVAKATHRLGELRAEGVYEQHAAAFEGIAHSLTEPLTAGNLFEQESAWTLRTRSEVDRLRRPLEKTGERLVEAMSRYLREFKEQQTDLNASRESLDSFLALLEQVRHEDLPRHEQKFKDRLNDKVTQEIGLFINTLNEERRRIEGKVSQLNRSLSELEYRPGTFMRLEPREVADREIKDFKTSLRECLDDTFDASSEANEARYLRIEKLVACLGDTEKTRWRDKVIDVRNWFTFAAREVDRESGDTRSFHEGSTGQSGGEKAKLAFTILVAALAYQYDLDPHGAQPGRFQFVVVDEMFSKIDDQNAEYALRLFEQFGLQLLIVAPLDAKARVTEPFVDSYLQVVKDEATGRSQLLSMTAREYEEVVQQFAGASSPGERRLAPK